MRDFQEKKRWRNIVESKPVLVLFFVLLIAFGWGVIGLFNKMQTTIENKNIAEEKFIELQNKKETFTEDVAKLNTESGIEDTLREKFAVVKEGEGLIVVVDEKIVEQEPAEESKSFFSFLKFWHWFK